MSDTVEHRFMCPNCGEAISMVLDLSAGSQRYVEDCEVCCRPLDITFTMRRDGRLGDFSATFEG